MSLRLYFSGIRISLPYLLFNLVELSLSKKKEAISEKAPRVVITACRRKQKSSFFKAILDSRLRGNDRKIRFAEIPDLRVDRGKSQALTLRIASGGIFCRVSLRGLPRTQESVFSQRLSGLVWSLIFL
jgi:hypothetical protein